VWVESPRVDEEGLIFFSPLPTCLCPATANTTQNCGDTSMSGEVTVRKFKKEDQYACAEHLFRTVRPLRITPPPFPVASPCPPVCIKCVLMPRPVGMQGMTAIGEPESNMYKIQKWFTDHKLMEGEDMYDIYAWYDPSQQSSSATHPSIHPSIYPSSQSSS